MLEPRSVIVLGGGGIGRALAKALLTRYPNLQCVLTYNTNLPKTGDWEPALVRRLSLHKLDGLYEENFVHLAAQLRKKLNEIDWIINTIGLLHNRDVSLFPEKRLKDFDALHFNHVVSINVLPTVFAAKHLAPLFPKKRESLFASVSARVGSITDNRLGGWHSYRASKACLNMMIKNIAIEWAYRHPQVCVLALHPGTTDSNLSKPFQKNVAEGKLFSPMQCANYLIEVMLSKNTKHSGQFYDWDNRSIDW